MSINQSVCTEGVTRSVIGRRRVSSARFPYRLSGWTDLTSETDRRVMGELYVNIWHVRHRLLIEQLDDLLYAEEAESLDEQVLRLIAAARVLLAQHQVNKQGRCRHCYYCSTWLWLRRRKMCTVHTILSVAMNQPFSTVWKWLADWSVHRR